MLIHLMDSGNDDVDEVNDDEVNDDEHDGGHPHPVILLFIMSYIVICRIVHPHSQDRLAKWLSG